MDSFLEYSFTCSPLHSWAICLCSASPRFQHWISLYDRLLKKTEIQFPDSREVILCICVYLCIRYRLYICGDCMFTQHIYISLGNGYIATKCRRISLFKLSVVIFLISRFTAFPITGDKTPYRKLTDTINVNKRVHFFKWNSLYPSMTECVENVFHSSENFCVILTFMSPDSLFRLLCLFL